MEEAVLIRPYLCAVRVSALQSDHVNVPGFDEKRAEGENVAPAFRKAELTREGKRQQKIIQ
jgi:hypothetical protein